MAGYTLLLLRSHARLRNNSAAFAVMPAYTRPPATLAHPGVCITVACCATRSCIVVAAARTRASAPRRRAGA